MHHITIRVKLLRARICGEAIMETEDRMMTKSDADAQKHKLLPDFKKKQTQPIYGVHEEAGFTGRPLDCLLKHNVVVAEPHVHSGDLSCLLSAYR